jgi:hypothetical protein
MGGSRAASAVVKPLAALPMGPVLGTLLVLAALCLGAPPAQAARARVSIQPIAGDGGPRLRSQVVRLVRKRGFRVFTEIPTATGTSQYYTWAREAKLTAFVSGELENLGRRQRATFLVWSGNTGSIVGRWTVTAPTARLPQTVARDFWRRLGRALHRAKPPAQWREPSPGPTLRIDASSAHDGEVVGTHYSGRRRRTR